MRCSVYKVVVLLFLALATGKADSSEELHQSKNDPKSEPIIASANQIPNPIIKLAILYDSEFGDRFDNDPQKIHEYWEVVMYDLHLRFQTLPSFVTSFQVTSLNAYKEPENQSFFERVRKNLNDHDAVNELREDFQTWVYKQLGQLPSVDIAVLAVGTPHYYINFSKDKSIHGSICRAQNDIDEKWMASTVISFQAFPNPAEILAVHIASILGAPSDNDPSFWNVCDASNNDKQFCCILGSSRPYPQATPKFFSHCTDQFLTKQLAQLESEKRFCMKGSSTQSKPIIHSVKLFENPSKLHGYTMTEQCKLLLNDQKVKIEIEDGPYECVEAVCLTNSTDQKVLKFTPLEGSRCGTNNNGRCFRGNCIEHKIQLVNVATGKCLVSEKSMFATNDKPILQECSQVVTQALAGPGTKNCYGREELVVALPYSTSNWVSYKRLTRNIGDFGLKFCRSRSTTCRNTLVEIHRLEDTDGQEFLVELDNVRLYLKAKEDGVNVEVTHDGSGKDKATRWKLVELVKGAAKPHNCENGKVIQEPVEEPVFELKQKIEL